MKDINKLVEKVKSNDKKAFEELYSLTASELYWYCKRLCKNDDEVKDLLQEVYFNAWQKINQYNGSSFKSWLYSIARNLWINGKKKKKEELFSDDEFIDIADNDSLIPDNLSAKRINHEEIIKLIDETLNDSQKLTVLMYYYNEKSIGEIAKELNCSEIAVQSRLHRARAKLQSKIKDKNLYSISLPLLFMFDSQKADFPDVLNVIRKSIMHKITLTSVETKCFIGILSTVALVGGTLAVSDIDLPSKEQPLIKAVDNSVIAVCDTSEPETSYTSQTDILNSDTVSETEIETTDYNIPSQKAILPDYSISDTQIETVSNETIAYTSTESDIDAFPESSEAETTYGENLERYISELRKLAKEEGMSDEDFEKFALPVFIDTYYKNNLDEVYSYDTESETVPKENDSDTSDSVSDTE